MMQITLSYLPKRKLYSGRRQAGMPVNPVRSRNCGEAAKSFPVTARHASRMAEYLTSSLAGSRKALPRSTIGLKPECDTPSS